MKSVLQNYISFQDRVFSHLLFWLTFWMFFSILLGGYTDKYGQAFLEYLMALPVIVAATYFTLYFLLPRYLLPRKYVEFFVILLLSALVFGVFQRLIVQYLINPLIRGNSTEGTLMEILSLYKIVKNIVFIYTIVIAATAVKLFKISYQKESARQLLAQQKLEAELKFLKSQIHPHFLFNTLNNLYALTLKNSRKAPEVVLKLSSLLDYMLYESNVPKVPLAKEISLINNYISLEKLRYGNRLEVSFNFSIDSLEKSIAPLLILPFVENSFRHGVSKELQRTFVAIDLSIKNEWLTLKVENTKHDFPDKVAKDYHSISLRNVQRRLNLLYPNHHELQIFDEEDMYLIVLKLKLNAGIQPDVTKTLQPNHQQTKEVAV